MPVGLPPVLGADGVDQRDALAEVLQGDVGRPVADQQYCPVIRGEFLEERLMPRRGLRPAFAAVEWQLDVVSVKGVQLGAPRLREDAVVALAQAGVAQRVDAVAEGELGGAPGTAQVGACSCFSQPNSCE